METLTVVLSAFCVVNAKMGTPCRSGNDCAVINTQRDIRQFTEQARKAASEAGDAVRMSQATSVAREAATRVLEELSKSESQVAIASVAKSSAQAAANTAHALEKGGEVGEVDGANTLHLHHHGESRVVAMALAAVHAADEATAAGVAAAAARTAARSHEGAESVDVSRAKSSGEVRLIARMAREAESALALAAEDERLHKYEAVLAEAQASSQRIQAQTRLAHHAAYEARHTARRIAIAADDARARLAVSHGVFPSRLRCRWVKIGRRRHSHERGRECCERSARGEAASCDHSGDCTCCDIQKWYL